MEAKQSFFAHAAIGAGGSWAREPTADEAVKSLCRILVADWGSMYALDGADIEVAIYDVTGRDVEFSRRGDVKDSETGEWLEPTIRTVRLTDRKHRKRR